MESLSILGIDPENITCVYCGDRSTEWDHLRPIITNQQPTGYITEIANLVPACGKCNQSKGKQHWHTWMLSSARLSPSTRKVSDIDARVEKLTLYEMWKPPTKIDFNAVVSASVWEEHCANWRNVLELLEHSQKLAKEIREAIANAPRHHNLSTGQITYGMSPATGPNDEDGDADDLIPHEEVFARLTKRKRWKP